jgi:transposase-like protein
LKERSTVSELAVKYQLNPVQITQWKKQLIEQSAAAFGIDKESRAAADKDVLIDTLYKKIGQYQVDLTGLKKIWPIIWIIGDLART